MEDSSNSDTDFTRNAVRETLCGYSQSEIEHIAATAEHMQGYVDWLDGQDTKAAGKAKLYEELKAHQKFKVLQVLQHLLQSLQRKTKTNK